MCISDVYQKTLIIFLINLKIFVHPIIIGLLNGLQFLIMSLK